MPPCPYRVSYRATTEREREFLRVEIAEYDRTGWCYVRSLGGPPLVPPGMRDGPSIEPAPAQAEVAYIEILLWTTANGMLSEVEVVEYGDGFIDDPYQYFIDEARAARSRLRCPADR